jgi:hypothetical protein
MRARWASVNRWRRVSSMRAGLSSPGSTSRERRPRGGGLLERADPEHTFWPRRPSWDCSWSSRGRHKRPNERPGASVMVLPSDPANGCHRRPFGAVGQGRARVCDRGLRARRVAPFSEKHVVVSEGSA